MTTLIRSRAACIDTALFVTAAVLWAVCPYLVHRVSSSDYARVDLVRTIAPNHGRPAGDVPAYATSDQTTAVGHDAEYRGL